jgi:hypothetical protein
MIGGIIMGVVGMMTVVETGRGDIRMAATGWVHPGAVRYITGMEITGDTLISAYGLPLRRLGDPATLLKTGNGERSDRYIHFGINHRVEARASKVESQHRLLQAQRGKMGACRELAEIKAPGLSTGSACHPCPSLDLFQGQALFIHADDCTLAPTVSLLRRMASGRLPAPGHWLTGEAEGMSWYAPGPGTVVSHIDLKIVLAIPLEGEIRLVGVKMPSGMCFELKPGDRFEEGQKLFGVRRRRVEESELANSHEILSHLERSVLRESPRGCLVSSAAVDQLRYRCTACLSDGGLRVPNSAGTCRSCGASMVPTVRAWWDCSKVGVRLAVPSGTHHEEVLLPEQFAGARKLMERRETLRKVYTA